MAELTPEQVLDLPMEKAHNDAGASSVREYLGLLTAGVVKEGEGFDGKRPFGNSSWEWELYLPLVKAGAVEGVLVVEDGYESLDDVDTHAADALLIAACEALGKAAADGAPAGLNVAAVDAALRSVVSGLDYDLHKSLERDEESGEDTYHEHVAQFVAAYQQAVATLAAVTEDSAGSTR